MDDSTLNQRSDDDNRSTKSVDCRRVSTGFVSTGRIVRHAVCALLVICTAGCATERYYAKNLPAELEPPPVTNAQTVDLSKFAIETAGGDVIHAGDILRVTISAGFNRPSEFVVRVETNGMTKLPVIGMVALGGLEPETAEGIIRTAAVQGGFYRDPYVTVLREQQQENQIRVAGSGVTKPGIFRIPRHQSDLLTAILTAEGLTESADTWIEIRRPAEPEDASSFASGIAGRGSGAVWQVGHSFHVGASRQPRIIRVDLANDTNLDSKSKYLPDGSVVLVNQREPQVVHVMGLVTKPGRYEIPAGQDLRVLQAIAEAQGVSMSVADKVFISRVHPVTGERKVIQLSIQAATNDGRRNIRLASGDIISVQKTPVTMLMEVFQIIRFAITGSAGLFF